MCVTCLSSLSTILAVICIVLGTSARVCCRCGVSAAGRRRIICPVLCRCAHSVSPPQAAPWQDSDVLRGGECRCCCRAGENAPYVSDRLFFPYSIPDCFGVVGTSLDCLSASLSRYDVNSGHLSRVVICMHCFTSVTLQSREVSSLSRCGCVYSFFLNFGGRGTA